MWAMPHSHQGCAFDGRYLYLAPGFHTDPSTEAHRSGMVVRFDTAGDFHSACSYRTFDLAAQLDSAAACYDGAVFDGRYIYLVPLYNGRVVRYDTTGDFGSPDAWQRFDAAPLGMGWAVGATFDGRYIYFDSYDSGRMVRYDTHGQFTQRSGWSVYDAGNTDGLETRGFDGGFFDGRYVYFVPFVNIDSADRSIPPQFHANVLRYDPLGAFDDPASWSAADGSNASGLIARGYNGGAFDGRYFYCAPWQNGLIRPAMKDRDIHGRVLRYDTLGTHGRFSLRYGDCGHNGGLNAALRGAAFLVNTDAGCRTVASHKALTPGRHYLAGTYDGREISLFIDGLCVARQAAAGRLVAADVPLEIGSLAGASRFDGTIEMIRISRVARSDAFLRDRYDELIRPDSV